MYLKVLKSKLKAVIVTEANVEYPGSITLDPILMENARLKEFEFVEVNAKNGKSRINTYVIAGTRGSGEILLNGGAANFFKKGDIIHVNCFGYIGEDEEIIPKIVYTNEFNLVISVR